MRHAFDASELGVSQKPMRPQSAKVRNNQIVNPTHQNYNYQDYQYTHEDDPQYQEYPQPQQLNHRVPVNHNKFGKRNGSAERQLKPPMSGRKNNNNYLNISHTNDVNQSNISNEYSRQLPKNISVDKEKLYADNLTLKNKCNTLNQENIRYKTRQAHLEKLNLKLEKQIEDMQQNGVGRAGYAKGGNQGDNTFLVNSLKKQVRELKEELESKDGQLNQLKKNIKCTRLQELDMERLAYEQEAKRLKSMLEQALKQKMQALIQESDFSSLEEKYGQQLEQIEQLRADNGELASMLKSFEDNNYRLQDELDQVDKKCKRDVGHLKRQLKQKEKEINDMKMSMQLQNPHSKKGVLSRPVSAKPQQSYQNNNQQFSKRPQQQYRPQKQTQQQQNYQQQQQQQEQQQQYDQYFDNEIDDNNNIQEQEQEYEQYNQEPQQPQKPQLPTIQFISLVSIGEEIKFSLQALALNWEDLMKDVFKDQDGETTIFQLSPILTKEPFYQSEENAHKLARYLVEGDEEQMVYYDEHALVSNYVIMDRFFNLVQSYKVWTPQEAEQIFKEIGEMLDTYKSLLETTFQMNENRDKKGTISKEKLLYSFEQVDIELTQDQSEFLISSVILDSEGINQLQYPRFFEIFKKTPKEYTDEEYDDYGQSEEFLNSYNEFSNNRKQIKQHHKNNTEENDIINKYIQDTEKNELQEEIIDEEENSDLQKTKKNQYGNSKKNHIQVQEENYEDDYEEEIIEDELKQSKSKDVDEAIVSDYDYN